MALPESCALQMSEVGDMAGFLRSFLVGGLTRDLGNLRSLNELAKQARADHIIHTGDFGFYDDTSLERIADK